MPGISTLRGNSSTARSGWVAADAANSRVHSAYRVPAIETRAQKNGHISGSLTGRDVPVPIGTIPERACRSAAQNNHLQLRSNAPHRPDRAYPMVHPSNNQDAVIRKSRRPEYYARNWPYQRTS